MDINLLFLIITILYFTLGILTFIHWYIPKRIFKGLWYLFAALLTITMVVIASNLYKIGG